MSSKRQKRCAFHVCLSQQDNLWVASFVDIEIDNVGGYTREEVIRTAIMQLTYHLLDVGYPRNEINNESKGEIVRIEPDANIVKEEKAIVSRIYLDRI